jgi:FAD binding domain
MHGLAISSGDYGDVGVGGLATAGGIGFLGRKHGLTIDHVLAAELVLADGTLLRVDADAHPDLFWAIRGRRQLRHRHGVRTRRPPAGRGHPLDDVLRRQRRGPLLERYGELVERCEHPSCRLASVEADEQARDDVCRLLSRLLRHDEIPGDEMNSLSSVTTSGTR